MTNNNYLSETMKFQLVTTVLLVGCTLAPSLSAPLQEEGEVMVVLQAIQTLLASENHGRGELQETVTGPGTIPPTAYIPVPLNKTRNGYMTVDVQDI